MYLKHFPRYCAGRGIRTSWRQPYAPRPACLWRQLGAQWSHGCLQVWAMILSSFVQPKVGVTIMKYSFPQDFMASLFWVGLTWGKAWIVVVLHIPSRSLLKKPCPGSLDTFTARRLISLSSAMSPTTLQWTMCSVLATKSTSGDAFIWLSIIVEATRLQGWSAQMVSIRFWSPLSAELLSEPPMMTTGDQGPGSPGKLWNLIQKVPFQRNYNCIF